MDKNLYIKNGKSTVIDGNIMCCLVQFNVNHK